MSDIWTDIERAIGKLWEPLGDSAPQYRKLTADYKDSSGQDFHQTFATWGHERAADAALVEIVRDMLAHSGYTLGALTEHLEDGKGRVLYLTPGRLKELISGLGLPVSTDTAAGVRPVNWDELTGNG